MAQIEVKGTVVDINNNALANVAVYVNGTTLGTTTDFEGKFSLLLPSKLNTYLVVSYVGYKPQYFAIEDKNFELNIILVENRIELKEVTLDKSRFSREQLLRLFKEIFLGDTEAGLNCRIINEDDLYFKYDEENYIFDAFSDQPLQIENNYLGYTIEYTLLQFQCNLTKVSAEYRHVASSIYGGTSIFTDVDASEEKLNRRKISYYGSTLHLFRTMVAQEWLNDEFAYFKEAYIINPKKYFEINKLSYNLYSVNIRPQKNSNKDKNLVAEFGILYNKKEHSKVFFFTKNFTIDNFGLHSDYDKIYFSGDITKRKVGDMLPSNYGL